MKATSLKTAVLLAGSIALLAGNATAQATSGVVGYETLDINPGFNFLGLRLHSAEFAVGTFDGSTGSTLTDSGADFSAAVAGTTYITRMSSGAEDGTLITALGSDFTATELAGLSGITASFEADYEIRAAVTIADIFGAANESGLLSDADPASSDVVWLPDGAGGFDQFYYSPPAPPFNPGGWTQIGGGAAADTPLIYTDGIIVQRRGGTPLSLVVTGDLLTGNATSPVLGGSFNFLSSLYPVGATLTTSGLTPQVLSDGDPALADVIWVADGVGGFNQYYNSPPVPPFNPGGWTQIGGGASPDAVLETSFIWQRRGGAVDATLTPPSFYAGL